jgi:hypothetical protein
LPGGGSSPRLAQKVPLKGVSRDAGVEENVPRRVNFPLEGARPALLEGNSTTECQFLVNWQGHRFRGEGATAPENEGKSKRT